MNLLLFMYIRKIKKIVSLTALQFKSYAALFVYIIIKVMQTRKEEKKEEERRRKKEEEESLCFQHISVLL
jgi:hypothetical protein